MRSSNPMSDYPYPGSSNSNPQRKNTTAFAQFSSQILTPVPSHKYPQQQQQQEKQQDEKKQQEDKKDQYIKELEEQLLKYRRENRKLKDEVNELKSQLLIRDLERPTFQIRVNQGNDLRSMMFAMNIGNDDSYLPQEAFQSNQDQTLTYEEMLALQEEVGVVSKGLTEESLKELKKQSCLADRQLVASNTNCTICLSQIVQKDRILRLPQCRHIYHEECIGNWLTREKNCPVCKKEIQI